MQTNKIYIAVFFVFISHFVMGQNFEFKTSVDKSTLGVNQRLKIEFNVNKKGADNFKAPDFSNFKIIAGPSSSVSQSWINGKTSYSHSYVYFLQPKSMGTFTIPAASIEYEGKKVFSNTVSIQVTKLVATSKKPNDTQNIAQKSIFLVASLSNNNPYIGEGIYVEYRLYFSKRIGFGNVQFGDNPKHKGFWNQEIPIKKHQEKKGKYKGESFNYYTLKKTVLIPQKSGKLYIDPLEMDVVVEVPSGRYDFFGNALTRRVDAHYSSNREVVQVKALPTADKPIDFSGAVGDFQLQVSSSKQSLKANESTQLKVVVRGEGNFKLFKLPEINVPSELEAYNPEKEQDLRTTLRGLKGSISNNYAIVPEYKGKYKIPSVSFSYFNPKDKEYHQLNAEAIIINVIEGKELPNTARTNNSHSETVVSNSQNNFRFISTKTVFQESHTTDFLGSSRFYILLGFPFILLFTGIFIGNRRKQNLADTRGNKIRKADRLAKKYLSDAKKQLGNKQLFYVALEKALHNFLKAKLQVETVDISQDNIANLLKENQVSSQSIEEFINVLNDCDFARYAPSSKLMMKEDYHRASLVISKLNNEF